MASQSSASKTMVEVKPPNDPRKGFDFEDEVALHAVLKLKEHQALAREVKFAQGFDDIVLVNNFNRNNQPQEYYLFQLKHKQDSMKNITWEDLLGKTSVFSLANYFASYLGITQNITYPNELKALVIVTNVGLDTSSSSNLSQPQQLMQNSTTNLNSVIQGKARGPAHHITQQDLSFYFRCQQCNSGTSSENCFNNIARGKRYKFSPQGIKDVTSIFSKLKVITQQNVTQCQKFLALLQFEVNSPNLEILKKINKALLKIFFPFHWERASEERCFQEVENKVLRIFKPLPGNNNMVNWATVGDRQAVFNELIPLFKQDLLLGSIKGYETGPLTKLFNQLKFNENQLKQNSSCTCVFKEILLQKSGFKDVVNIFCNESNATVIALKILRTIQDLSIHHKTLVVQVNGEEGIENIINHFNELNKEIRDDKELIKERFYFVIEVSPFLQPADEKIKYERIACCLIQRLNQLTDLRILIQFVIVTQHPIILNNIQDNPLNWTHLPDAARNYLFEKTIFLEGDIKKTSLAALGLKEETIGDWMDPVSLAELITHDESRPLCLGFPKHDADLEAMYVDRKIKIPTVQIHGMHKDLQHRIVFNEKDYCRKSAQKRADNSRIFHLVKRIDSSTKTYYLWSKSTDTGARRDYYELSEYVERSEYSDYEIDESQLLMEENVCFGTGSPGNKLLIVVDLPGKGKTYLLTRLANQFVNQQSKKDNLDRLILRMNLLEIKASLWQNCRVIENEEAAVNFLLGSLQSNTSEAFGTSLSRAIIKHMCISNSAAASVFVLLDGFDEISDEQRSIIFRLTEQLLYAKGIKRIILTSRPDNGLEEKLEKHFTQFPLHLRNFTKQDQIDFLVKRWSGRLSHQDDTEKSENYDEGTVNEKIKNYAQALVKYSQKALKDENRSFLDIPLQCMIISECFFNDMKQYLTECQSRNPSDSRNLPTFQEENFQLLHLYDKFYETKVDILFQEKANISSKHDTALFVRNVFKENCLSAVIRLSIFQMMTDIKDAQTLCCTSWKFYKNLKYARDLMRARKLGLIQGADENQFIVENLEAPHVKFIHRTFAEYFFASFLIKTFIQTHSKLLDSNDFDASDEILYVTSDQFLDLTYNIITKKILIDTEYAGIVRFFKRMLVNYIPLVPIEQRSLFAIKDREDVLKEWPVIGHEQFNRFLAKTLASECSGSFKKWTREQIDRFDSSELLQRDAIFRYRSPLFTLLCERMEDEKNKLPNLNILLMYCIKEYASRPHAMFNDEREALAHGVTMILLRVMYKDRQFTALLIQFFDPAKDLSDEENYIFSK